MKFDTVVNDVKDVLEDAGSRAQGAAEVSLKTLKQANEIVIAGVQDVVEVQAEAGKALIEAGKASLEKAKSAGLVAVAQSPIEYLPETKDTVVSAFDESLKIATKTGEQLAKVFKTGYSNAAKKISGRPVKKTVRKVARKAAKTTEAAVAA